MVYEYNEGFSIILNLESVTLNLPNNQQICSTSPMTELRKQGRPKTGKNSDPKYTLMSGYVLRSTWIKAKHFLIDNDDFKDMGDLLDVAIVEFLSKRNYKKARDLLKNTPGGE